MTNEETPLEGFEPIPQEEAYFMQRIKVLSGMILELMLDRGITAWSGRTRLHFGRHDGSEANIEVSLTPETGGSKTPFQIQLPPDWKEQLDKIEKEQKEDELGN